MTFERTPLAAPLPLALFVGSWLPWSETFVYDQLRRQQRFRAHVFARGRTPAAARFPYPAVTSLSPAAGAWWFWTGRAPAIARALERLQPRIVHAHFGLNGALALPFARARDVPLAVSFHGHDVSGLFAGRGRDLQPRYARYRRLAPALFEYASVLLCASSELAELLHDRAGAPAHKLVVHRLGVELARFANGARDPDAFRVLMAGRMVEKKGMRYGLAAFARVVERHPRARLAIAGDGPLRAALLRQVQALGVGHAVELLGALSAQQVHAELARASVLLAPSVVAADGDRESGMLVVKEAGAAQLPVVASRHGGIPEIVADGQTGFLVAERDVAALAERLCQLAAEPALRERMGAAARAKIEREYDGVRQDARLEQRLLACVTGTP